jgi:hypothetical protein
VHNPSTPIAVSNNLFSFALFASKFSMTITQKNIAPKADAQLPRGLCGEPSAGGALIYPICGIYKITSPEQKVYIGKSEDIIYRFRLYRKLACKGQKKLYNSLKKYGWQSHKFEVIHQCTHSEMHILERQYIEAFPINDLLNVKFTAQQARVEIRKELKKAKDRAVKLILNNGEIRYYPSISIAAYARHTPETDIVRNALCLIEKTEIGIWKFL